MGDPSEETSTCGDSGSGSSLPNVPRVRPTIEPLTSTDTLLTLAEIAAAFAGFAALVSVIRTGTTDDPEAVHDLLRLRLVISSGVAGVAAALLPVGLAGYGLHESLTWRIAAFGFLVIGNGIIVSFLRAYRPVQGTFPPDTAAVSIVSFLELTEQGSLLVVLLGIPIGNPAALFVTALIINLCQAGFIFVRFIESAFRHDIDVV